ncbi:MAG: DUF4251 domain-containing protein [Bacteroidales bacterium]
MKKSILSLLILLFVAAGCSSTQNTAKSDQRAADMEKMASLIEGGNYVYTIQSISPTGGRTVQSTTRYTMKAVDGNFEANLPYIGRAYAGAYGGDGGIEFNGSPENLKIEKNSKKGNVTVNFSIEGEKDRFTVNLVVGSGGYGTLSINSQNRQGISYYGMVTPSGE